MTKILTLFFFILFLTSCDPGFGIVLTNESNRIRQVKVVKAKKNKLRYTDSIAIFYNSGQYFYGDSLLKKTLIIKDTSENLYSFHLDKGNKALLEADVGFPNMSQKIIVDNIDTIFLKTDKRVKIKKKGFSTEVTVTIR